VLATANVTAQSDPPIALPRDDSVWVRLTGGPGVKQALAAEMGIGPTR